MDNRRQQERTYLTTFTQVLDRRSGRLLGYLADLTTGGALLVGDQNLETGSLLHLKIGLPENYPRQMILLDARVAWSQPESEPDTYKVGLQLVNPQPDDLSLLGRLISDYGFNPQ